MHYVYLLRSLRNKKYYSGYTEDLKRRLSSHKLGKVSSTENRRPLELVYYEACLDQKDALHREKYFKTTWGKRYLKLRLKSFLGKAKI